MNSYRRTIRLMKYFVIPTFISFVYLYQNWEQDWFYSTRNTRYAGVIRLHLVMYRWMIMYDKLRSTSSITIVNETPGHQYYSFYKFINSLLSAAMSEGSKYIVDEEALINLKDKVIVLTGMNPRKFQVIGDI